MVYHLKRLTYLVDVYYSCSIKKIKILYIICLVLYTINYSKVCENIFNKFNMHFLRFLSSLFVSKDIASSDQKWSESKLK